MIRDQLRDISASALDKMLEFRIQEIIADGFITRAKEKLGGSHTVVTFPPLNSLVPISPNRIKDSIKPQKNIDLYQHISFCEFLCPFCSYTTTYSAISEEKKVNPYINALINENKLWLDLIGNSPISSLYIGGGTPTAISINHLEQLLQQLNNYRKTDSFSACSETSPLSIAASDGMAKIDLLKNWGVNRISIGIQSFNEGLLKRSRGYDKACAINAVENLEATGLEINIDLIQDLPDQTIEHIFEDLEQIERLRPHQVTWYIMRLDPSAPWYKTYVLGNSNPQEEFESLKKRLIIRTAMSILGYTSMPGGRFVKSPEYKDRYKEIRSGSDSTLLGMGASAYSHGWNYFFRNTHNTNKKQAIKEYINQIDKGELAIQSGMYLDEEIVFASKLVKGIRANVKFDEDENGGVNYLPGIRGLLNKLHTLGLVQEPTRNSYQLTAAGFLFEEEICSLLYNESIKYKLLLENKYWHTPQHHQKTKKS